MKTGRFFAAILCILSIFFLTSCGETVSDKDISMDMIVEANNNKALLAKHNSFSIKCVSGDEVYNYFITENVRYEYDGNVHNVINNDGHFQMHSQGEYATVLYAGVKPVDKNENLLVLDKITSQETITERYSEGDNIILKTKLPEEVYSKYLKEAESYSEGSYLENEYTVNHKTLEITSMVEKIFNAKGDMIGFIEYTVEFNKVMPVEINDILLNVTQREDWVENSETIEETKENEKNEELVDLVETETEEPSENTEKEAEEGDEEEEKRIRTIKVILDPNTENEKEYQTTVISGNTVNVVRPDGYDKLYLDAELTVEFKEDDLKKDLILYSANGR